MMNQTQQIPKALSVLAGLTPGDVADEAARAMVFERYQRQLAAATHSRQRAGLKLLAAYLVTAGVPVTGAALASSPEAWAGLSWGLLEGWLDWLLSEGYAIGSINVRLSTAKVYARLAFKAGAIGAEQYALIAAVRGFSQRTGRRVDEQRRRAGLPTRRGRKKATAVAISKRQAGDLKNQPDDTTAQGRRDALLMCLLLDHGLRCGEVAGLKVSDFDLAAGEMRFYRPKVSLTQIHRLTQDTLAAARAYFQHDALPIGPLLRSSRKDGRLHDAGMCLQAINGRVRVLGRRVGLAGLSPHDCRHYWITQAARNGTPVDRLQDAGGWSSSAMPLAYIERAKIANEGVRL